MKKILSMFALMAVFLMGSVSTVAKTTLTYDFKTIHPSGDTSLEGRKYFEGNYAFWGGTWSGFFGKKIAFDMSYSNDIYLQGTGGLAIRQSGQKIYLMDVENGDEVKIWFSGTNANLIYGTNSTASLNSPSKGESLVSESNYYVLSSGKICIQTTNTTTVIDKIVVTSVKNNVSVQIPYGMATLGSNVPLDFSNVDAKAYIATAFADGKFTFKRITYVPANVGVLVVPNSGQSVLSVPVGRGVTLVDNMVPSDQLFCTSIYTNIVYNNPPYYYYVFGYDGSRVRIFKETSSTFVAYGGHAYLRVPY